MNESEKIIMDELVSIHNKFIQLEQTHPSDITEWVTHIHGLQKILSLRIVRRDYPESWTTKK